MKPPPAIPPHVIAALGEGHCPACTRRLEPIDTPRGTGGRCAPCDAAWYLGPTSVDRWTLHNPYNGEPIPMRV